MIETSRNGGRRNFDINVTFFGIFVNCGTKFKSITRALYISVNTESA